MRDLRPFETEAEVARETLRLKRLIEIHDELGTLHLDPHVEQLLAEWERLQTAELLQCEDHMLKIAGHLCMEAGQADLWRRIFVAAMAGSQVDPDDELRFLDHNFGIDIIKPGRLPTWVDDPADDTRKRVQCPECGALAEVDMNSAERLLASKPARVRWTCTCGWNVDVPIEPA